MTKIRKAPRETPLTRPARVTRQSRGSRSIDRTSRARYADSASAFPHLRSLSPYNSRIKEEVGTEHHNALILSVEEHNVKDEGDSKNDASNGAVEEKQETLEVQSVEADEVKMAELRLASVDQAEQKPVDIVDGNGLPSIKTLLRVESEQRNSEVYQEFLESYSIVVEKAAALCAHWSPYTWFVKQELPSMEHNQQLEAFYAEFLDGIKVMQSSLDHIRPGDRAHNVLIQAIRRFLRHLFRVSLNVLQRFPNGLEASEDSHLKVQIALVGDLVHLLGDVIGRMFMVAKKNAVFPHHVGANLKIQTAIAVPIRLREFEFPQNLLLPQFVTRGLIVANADFL